MKRIIRLTESDLTRIVKKILKESENQRYIDMVLDKIGQEGVGSMSEFEKRILDDENIDVYQELLNKIRNEKGTKNLTKLEKQIYRDFGVEEPKHEIEKEFLSSLEGSGSKIVRQEDRTKLDDAYIFLKDYVENNLRVVENFKNGDHYYDYIDAVYFMDDEDNIKISFFRQNPHVKYYKGLENNLVFESEFWSFIAEPFGLKFIDMKEVVYRWGVNMFGTTNMMTGIKDAKFMKRP